MCSDVCLNSHKQYEEQSMIKTGFYWFCVICRAKIDDAPKPFIEMIVKGGTKLLSDSVTDEISEMKNHINQIDTDINRKLDALKESFDASTKTIQDSISTTSWANIVSGTDKVGNETQNSNVTDKAKSNNVIVDFAKQVVNNHKKITLDREERENNIIIFNAPEENLENTNADVGKKATVENITNNETTKESTTNDDAREENKTNELDEKANDEKFFKKLCQQVLGIKETPEVKMIRIGHKQANKPRLLKVSFLNSWDKRKFLSSLPKLKNQAIYKDLRVSHDMCLEDRLENKKLLSQAYEMNKKDNPEGFKYKVRGPPWEMKIVKIYAKNSTRNN